MTFYYSFRRLLDPLTASRVRLPGVVHREREALHVRRQRHLRPGDPVEVELNLPADALNTVRGEVLRGKLVRIDDNEHGCGREVEHARPSVRRRDRRQGAAISGGRCATSRWPTASNRAGRCCSTSAKLGVRVDRRSHAGDRAREPDAVLARPARVLSAVAGASRLPGKVRHAGLDATGEHRHQRRLSAQRAAASAIASGSRSRQLLGPRQRAART